MIKKPITIEDLAHMVKSGFDEIHRTFMTKEESKDNFKVLVDEIRIMKDDIKDIKLSNVSLARIVGIHDKDIREIKEELEMV